MANNDHIPTAEVIQDIADTEAEIAQMEREAAGLEMMGDRMSMFRADARKDGIRRRREFVSRLRDILAERGEASSP